MHMQQFPMISLLWNEAPQIHTTGGTIGLYSLIVQVDPLGMIQVAKNHLRLLSAQTNAPLLPHGVFPNSGHLFGDVPRLRILVHWGSPIVKNHHMSYSLNS